jgi:hypothetical protein
VFEERDASNGPHPSIVRAGVNKPARSKSPADFGARDSTRRTRTTATISDWHRMPFRFGKVVSDLKTGAARHASARSKNSSHLRFARPACCGAMGVIDGAKPAVSRESGKTREPKNVPLSCQRMTFSWVGRCERTLSAAPRIAEVTNQKPSRVGHLPTVSSRASVGARKTRR